MGATMQRYIKVNDRFYPIEQEYAYCGQCKQFITVDNMSKGGYECKECSRKRAKEYYWRKCLTKI